MQKTYLVGGAVRDMVMGVEPKDRDYVVTGATEADMLAAGFEKVGADFPVFLKDGEEYALARRERKTGEGYHGFETDHGTDVTLEEDLARRDLTVNSMAMDEDGVLVDPFGGANDLRGKTLRHTSAAFAEDPVRVLRLARFRARLGADWTVAPETVELVSKMAKAGVLAELTPERVWKELSRALMEGTPRLFFDTLLETDALHVVFPEVYKLKTALEARRWHPEGDAFEHTMLVLTAAAKHGQSLEARVAALVHDFGKALTPRDKLPKHYGHEVTGVPVAENFARRLTMPAKTVERVAKTTRFHMHMHKLEGLTHKTVANMFMDMGALNDPAVVDLLLDVGVADHQGRLGSENEPVEQLSLVLRMFDAFRGVKFAEVFPNGETNPNKIKEGLFKARVAALKALWLSRQPN